MIPQAPSLSLALQYHQSGQLDAAAEIYREVLADEPQNADARHLLGLVALQSGNYELAADQILRAIRLKSGVAVFHSNLGVAYQSLKKLDEAIACFRRAIKLAPNHAEAHNNLANALREQGKVPEAIASWRRAVALKPNYVDAWSNLAVALRQLGNIGGVRRLPPHRSFGSGRTAPTAATTWRPPCTSKEKLDEAIAFYRRAIQLDPTFALPHNNLGNVLQEQGKLAEACQCYQRAIDLKPDFAEAHLGLASTQNEQGNSTDAIQHYLTAIQIKPGMAAAHCNLGDRPARAGRFCRSGEVLPISNCQRFSLCGRPRRTCRLCCGHDCPQRIWLPNSNSSWIPV